MNCCKVCSPTFFKAGRALSPDSTSSSSCHTPPFFNAGRALSPESTSSSSCHNNGSETDIDIVFAAEVTIAQAMRAKQFLVRMIPGAFWDLLHDRHTRFGHENDAGEKSVINWLTRYGAVKVRQRSMPRNHVWWIDPQTHVAYFDALNKHYSAVFDELWPRCFVNISNYEVKGDLMEAFLGFGFIMEQGGHHRKWGTLQQRILTALDTYIYYTYAAVFF